MIYISGIVISLFLSALLLFKKNKSTADNLLFAWMVVVTLHQLYFYFNHSPYFTKYASLIGIDMPMPLMHGPFLFLYAAALVGRLPKRTFIWLLHFVPAVICYVYLIGFYKLSAEDKLYIINNQGVGYELFITLRYIAIIISGVIYVALTLWLIYKHQIKIKDRFSDIEKINLKWLQYLTYGIGVIWLTVIFSSDGLTFIAVVLYVVFIGFFGIRQTPIFSNSNPPGELQNVPDNENLIVEDVQEQASVENSNAESEINNQTEESKSEKVKYQKSGLNESSLQMIHEQLIELMQREKLFTNAELTLSDTAQRMNIHPNYLSQVINSAVKKNFYDFINYQRVEEFKRIIQEPKNQQFTLLSLAFECGFNSKTSFNRNFRKVTGISPSEYLEQINVSID